MQVAVLALATADGGRKRGDCSAVQGERERVRGWKGRKGCGKETNPTR